MQCAPTITLSTTLNAGNSARFWNVRAIPTFAIRCGGSLSRSRSPRRIVPFDGW